MKPKRDIKRIVEVASLSLMLAGGLWQVREVTARIGSLEDAILQSRQEERVRDARWIQDDLDAAAIDQRTQQDIIHGQEAVAAEVGSLDVRVRLVERTLATNFLQRESRFEELETEHKNIVEAINGERADHGYRIGILTGRMERLIELIEEGH